MEDSLKELLQKREESVSASQEQKSLVRLTVNAQWSWNAMTEFTCSFKPSFTECHCTAPAYTFPWKQYRTVLRRKLMWFVCNAHLKKQCLSASHAHSNSAQTSRQAGPQYKATSAAFCSSPGLGRAVLCKCCPGTHVSFWGHAVQQGWPLSGTSPLAKLAHAGAGHQSPTARAITKATCHSHLQGMGKEPQGLPLLWILGNKWRKQTRKSQLDAPCTSDEEKKALLWLIALCAIYRPRSKQKYRLKNTVLYCTYL